MAIVVYLYGALLNNQFVIQLGSLLIGASLTFFIQSLLHNQKERLNQEKQAIKEVYAPLYFEIDYNFNNYIEKIEKFRIKVWEDIRYSFKYFLLNENLTKKLDNYYEMLAVYSDGITKSERVLEDKINYLFKQEFLSEITKEQSLHIAKEGLIFVINHVDGLKRDVLESKSYLWLGKDPINEYIKTNDIDDNDFYIIYYLDNNTNFREFYYPDYEKLYKKFLERLDEELIINPIIKQVRISNDELCENSKDLLKLLKKNIKKM